MIVTKETKTIYKVELTEMQREHLLLLLYSGGDGHVNELTIQANYDSQMADDVRETIENLIQSLKDA